MAIVSSYTDLDTVKLRLNLSNSATNDVALKQIITAVSRTIDGVTGRRFYKATETRYFTADCAYDLDIDDLISVFEIATDDVGNRTYATVWQASDYELAPYNAAALGMPYTRIARSPLGNYGFVTLRRGVRITGEWGWPEIPAPVSEAAVLMAVRLFKRKDAPYGIAGSSDLGQVQFLPRTDPDVRNLLDPYRRFAIGAV